MNKSRRTFAWILTVVAVSTGLTAPGQVGAQQSVPEDLRPLLTPRHSEMKFVAARYNADRNMRQATMPASRISVGGEAVGNAARLRITGARRW